MDKFDQASVLPEMIPSALNDLLGDYTFTFSITKNP